MKKLRNRYFAAFMLLNIVFETISPSVALALTNGPAQPDYAGFEPASSSEMVDLFTGDFKYNIPLMDVDGYPVNIAYHAGNGMDAEASWVGLGWSLSPGVLNRMVKGLPDDFNGDNITTTTKLKPTVTVGVGLQRSAWIGLHAKFSNLGFGAGVGANKATTLIYNNHTGFGKELDHDLHFSLSLKLGIATVGYSGGVGMSTSATAGVSTRKNYRYGIQATIPGINVGWSKGEASSINTRSGLMVKSFENGLSLTVAGQGGSFTGMRVIPSGPIAYSPKIPFDYKGSGFGVSMKFGFWAKVGFGIPGLNTGIGGGLLVGAKMFFNSIKITENENKPLPAYGYLYSEKAPDNSLMDFNRFREGAVFEETPNASYAAATYDIFFANAQGLGLSYRPFRVDECFVHDPVAKTESFDINAGGELGGPTICHVMANESYGTVSGQSGAWKTFIKQDGANKVSNLIAYNGSFESNAKSAMREKYYFKQFGEVAERDAVYEAAVGGESIMSPNLVLLGNDYHAFSPINHTGRLKRDVRTNYIESLTAAQASDYGYEKTIDFYTKGTYSLSTTTKMLEPSTTQRDLIRSVTHFIGSSTPISNHLSEISVTNKSGDRYIYGIPSYNILKKSVVFSASDRKDMTGNTVGGASIPGTSYTIPAVTLPSTQFSTVLMKKSHALQIVEYDPSADLSDNKRGMDNFYQKEELPPFANSFLLSDILSPNYVDVTGNGPTYDDLGTFTKFNYYKENEYGWREPYCFNPTDVGAPVKGTVASSLNQANLELGLLSDELDDKAFYQYGIRENHYLHSIESKNHIAVFMTSPKYDGLGVNDEHGLVPTVRQTLKLDSVKLYSKNEILAKGGINNAIPIKSIYFEYDYTLCPGTYNSLQNATYNLTRGKLTLRKLYFTYGNSKKSGLSPYEFTYADNDHNVANGAENNFAFDPRCVDRWGNYKLNSGATTGSIGILNNVEFPYTEQNKTLADTYAAAWNLSEIKTPTGATIKITYEADDYAYLQDETAGQMLKVYNYVNSVSPSDNVAATHSSPNTNIKDANYLIVDLSTLSLGIPTSLSLSNANALAKKDLFRLTKKLYYKCFLKLAGPETAAGINKDYYDFVPGYAYVNEVGLFNATNNYSGVDIDNNPATCYKYAYIKLRKEIGYKSTLVNPISFAGWDFLRNFLPRVAYPGSQPSNMGGTSLKPKEAFHKVEAGLGVAKTDFENAFDGSPNKRFYDDDFCTVMDFDKSFVRAFVPNKRKIGGGYRVKQIITQDNWAGMTAPINTSGINENSTTYGQTFDYTCISEDGAKISSGVAYYEPQTGGDEISLRQPFDFEIIKQLAPNDHFYQDKPLSEKLYPGAMVGYSKVTVKNMPDPNALNVCDLGRVEYGFFTAREFPIIDETAPISRQTYENTPTLDEFILIPKAIKIMHVAQGNRVIFNDMHGKLKYVKRFGSDASVSPISEISYHYASNKTNDISSRLVTTLPVIDEINTISEKIMSRDVDVTVDTRESITESTMQGSNLVTDIGLVLVPVPIPAPPVIIPMPDLPEVSLSFFLSEQKFGVRCATMTKVVQEYGVLEKTTKVEDKKTTTIENLLWDSKTGEVVLNTVTDNFNQKVYNYNYPAYWGYPQMGHVFIRDGISLYSPSTSNATPLEGGQNVLNVSTGILPAAVVHSNPVLFETGDEVAVYQIVAGLGLAYTKIGDRFWIVGANNGFGDYIMVDQNGKKLCTANYASLIAANDYKIVMVKPFSNNNLLASMGGVSSLTDPRLSNTSISYYQPTQKIIEAYGQEYCSLSGGYLKESLGANQQETNIGTGSYSTTNNPIIAGIYGAFKPSSSYRFISTRTYTVQPDSKTDGILTSFYPFWDYYGNPAKWKTTLPVNCNSSGVEAIGGGSPPVEWWQWTGGNTLYSPYGYLLESKNPVGIASTQQYGFNHSLPALSASNARQGEVGFDSFEEYVSTHSVIAAMSAITTVTSNIYNNDYLGFYGQSNIVNGASSPTVSALAAHTGRYSYYFGASQSVTLKHRHSHKSDVPATLTNEVHCGCPMYGDDYFPNVSKLNLVPGKSYILSMWVKGGTQALDYSNLVNISVKTIHNGTGLSPSVTNTSYSALSKTGIINGWQKLEFEFTLPLKPSHLYDIGTVLGDLEIKINALTATPFFMDDFRIQPFNASMVCNVYDSNQLRLWAQLDDRNFAKIYEYDNEGKLVRTKQETEKTIYTLNESRSGINKR